MVGAGENISGYIGINDYGFKGKRQYIADRRYLLDLYVVAYNNADIRTAITHQRNEIFRRGMEWKPKWDFRCPVDGKEYSATEAKRAGGKCKHEREVDGKKVAIEVGLDTPDERQKEEFDKFMDTCNYFGQSLETCLREIWDDINVVDDAFIFVSKEYFAHVDENEEIQLTAQPKYIFRLDPVLVEFDLDQRGIPGMRHHVCLIHRDELLEVPPGEAWELEWKGKCPQDGLPTYPVIYKYNESYLQGGYGSAGPTQLRYLTHGSVVLFGSRLGPSFVLDTVFVANKYVDHTVANYRPRLNGIVSKTYEMATLNALYRTQRPDLNDHRLYIGATPERSVEGMFSFFPCMSFEQSRDGFQRPQIRLPGYIAEKQAMGYKLTPGLGLGKMRQLWDEVVGQVTNAGLALGVSADLPQAGPACPLAAGPYPADRGSRASCSPAVRRNPRRDC